MAQVTANGIAIEVETHGGAQGPAAPEAVLLIRGLGSQLIHWPQALIDGLVSAGFHVVVFDNRDTGLSEKMDAAPDYRLSDMAADALGVLDALGIARAHVFGISMGGMIVQQLALTASARLLSATIVMSSSLVEGLSERDPVVTAKLLERPPGARAAYIEHSLAADRFWDNPGFPFDEAQRRALIGRAFDRCHCPDGVARQYRAIMASAGWAARLPEIRLPVMVIHGARDRLLPVDHGRDIATRVPASEWVEIAGMGHDLDGGVVEVILGHLLPFLARQTES
ncbi:MAG: alpha/beta hydrolase [Pseudomonadota bacterium]